MPLKPPRLTMPTMAVMDALLEAMAAREPVWGLRICERTGLGSGSVYPILDRVVEAGWVESSWEDEQPSGRPRRRFYHVSDVGQAEYAAARQAREARRYRPLMSWRPKPGGAG